MNYKSIIKKLREKEKEILLTHLVKTGAIKPEMLIQQNYDKLTPVDEWIKQHPEASNRLKNSLKYQKLNKYKESIGRVQFIETFTEEVFNDLHCAGKKRWDELVRLRGY